MGLFNLARADPNFIPGCRVVQEESTQGRVSLICESVSFESGKRIVPERPVKLIIEQGNPKPILVDGGGLRNKDLDQLILHLQKFGQGV